MAHSNVPTFGNWENQGNDVPYTVYFDKARKNKGGKMINPNDPQENPDMFRNFAPAPTSASPSKPRTRREKPVGMGAVGPTTNRRMSSEDDYRKFTNSPARSEILGQKTANESTQQNYGGRGMRYGRPARSSAGSEYSIDRSPLHPYYHAKIVEGGSGSPAQEGKNSYNTSHGNTGRSRLKPARAVESPDRGASVPRFGEWNDSDPKSAENFTGIFNKVREEKHPGPGIVSTTPKQPSFVAQNHQSEEKPKKCCFPWW
ncbi:RPM1-interacting 4-like isoform X2 [Olea europaea subsp. europaea]|uniref:RPM1-interacting 4-like isoform X2 n=1 Tax=Olea europaea subsp. europaea TaxID=158383 RepID=A0A8S0PX36_OLEEU|nr:RPM1-interacting 4-like isoform X2 [Olea europaea subsp. europaea]